MKIIITGLLGHISKPLTQSLLEKGHSVTVISSNPAKLKDLGALSTIPAVGSVYDLKFPSMAFTDADMVYCMVPPDSFFDPTLAAATVCWYGDAGAVSISE